MATPSLTVRVKTKVPTTVAANVGLAVPGLTSVTPAPVVSAHW